MSLVIKAPLVVPVHKAYPDLLDLLDPADLLEALESKVNGVNQVSRVLEVPPDRLVCLEMWVWLDGMDRLDSQVVRVPPEQLDSADFLEILDSQGRLVTRDLEGRTAGLDHRVSPVTRVPSVHEAVMVVRDRMDLLEFRDSRVLLDSLEHLDLLVLTALMDSLVSDSHPLK